MYDDPRHRALHQFAALLDLLTEMSTVEPGANSGAITMSERTTTRHDVWGRPQAAPWSELQTWVCLHYRWLVGVLLFQLITMVALMVALIG